MAKISFKAGFPKGGDFRNLGDDFKICGDELIQDILKLQLMSKKKGLRRIY